MEKRRKRVAHVGQHTSKKKYMEDDVVASIMKAMDSNIADSGSQEFCDILNATVRGKSANNPDMPLVMSKQPSMTLTQKKLLSTKRHPLMMKVQKNVNYIKHNRSMPKPRAHLGGLGNSIQRKKVESYSPQNSSSPQSRSKTSCAGLASSGIAQNSSPQLRSKSSCSVSSKYKANNRHPDNTFSGESVSKISSKLSESDSESDFEYFIQAQKEVADQDMQKSSKGKKNTKLKRAKQKSCSSKIKKLECLEGNTSDEGVLHKKFKKQKNSKILSKMTNTNRLKLPETSNSSNTSSGDEDCSLCPGESSGMPSAEEESNSNEIPELMNANIIRCSVRIERNPFLDKTACQSNSQLLEGSIESDACHSELLGEERKVVEKLKKDVVESDDDCMIISEVPKTDNLSVNIGATENGDIESDIQILNVISLKETKEDNVTNCGAASNSSFNEVSNKINYEKLKEAVQIARELESYKDVFSKAEVKESHSNLGGNMVENILPSGTLHKNALSVSPDVIEAVKNLDFNQILSLANSKSQSPAFNDVEQFNTSPSSLSIAEESPSFSKLPSNATVDIPESHWRNLKKAVNLNCLPDELETAAKIFKSYPVTSDFVTPQNHTNFSGNFLTSWGTSTPARNLSLNSSDLTKGDNTYQDESFGRCQLRSNYRDPCSELDVLTTSVIQNTSLSPSNQDLSKLVALFTQTYKEYELMTTVGVHLMQKRAADKRRSLETLLEQIMKHDPCLYSTALENKGAIDTGSNTNLLGNSENWRDTSSEETKKCISCGLAATINCDRCKMIYFCSETCGVHYWVTKHHRECIGLNG